MITSAVGRTILMCGAAVILGGCSPDGPSRYSISGSVTFQGRPVPVGFIKFEPDATKGNMGPGSGTSIQNGSYTVPSATGVLGGHYRIVVEGFDGIPAVVDGEKAPDGKLLFSNQQILAELPQHDSTKNIEVPASTSGSILPIKK
jgi:hypothetical protein